MKADIVILNLKDEHEGRAEWTESVTRRRLPIVAVQGRLESGPYPAAASPSA